MAFFASSAIKMEKNTSFRNCETEMFYFHEYFSPAFLKTYRLKPPVLRDNLTCS